MKKWVIIILCVLFLASAPVWAGSKVWTDTGAGNIAKTITFTGPALVTDVRLHLSAAGGANNLTVTLDSARGPVYDVVFVTQDMTSQTDCVFRYNPPLDMRTDDKIIFAWTNGSSRTYGLEVLGR